MTHSRKDNRTGGVNLGLIITPMLDMSFQILAFFIMTYHPSALEGNIAGNLLPPRADANPNQPKVDELQPPVNAEIDEAVQVTVNAVPSGGLDGKRADGQPATIFLQLREDVAARLVAGSDERIEESYVKLKAQLKRSLTDGASKTSVRLECQGDLKHQYVMELYDVCKGAGFQNISFVAPKRK